MVYADTGFLLSLYLSETTTAAASTAVRRLRAPLPLTSLTRLELRNGLRLAVFRGALREEQRAQCWAQVEEDVASGVYAAVEVPRPDLYGKAILLVDAHGARLGARTLDVLHVAAAAVLGATTFLSFDRRQRALAQAARMKVAP